MKFNVRVFFLKMLRFHRIVKSIWILIPVDSGGGSARAHWRPLTLISYALRNFSRRKMIQEEKNGIITCSEPGCLPFLAVLYTF